MLNRKKNNFPMFVNFVECAQKKTKKVGNGGIRTHEHQNTTALNQHLKPLCQLVISPWPVVYKELLVGLLTVRPVLHAVVIRYSSKTFLLLL